MGRGGEEQPSAVHAPGARRDRREWSELVALWPLPAWLRPGSTYPAPPPVPEPEKKQRPARDRNVVTSCVGAGLMTS